MLHHQIMVVEDETIVAKDIQRSLQRWGYDVPAIVPSGEEAIDRAEECHPDLVLMDIRLKGPMDGVHTGEQLRSRHDVPIVFLTAYADDDTLLRARSVEPYGYLVKPFQERELRATVEMALYKHRMEHRVKENERWLATILDCIGDAVIVTDAESQIDYLNPAAEVLTGWTDALAAGRPLGDVFRLVRESTCGDYDPTPTALRLGAPIALERDALLIARDGTRVPVEGSVAPIHKGRGSFAGFAIACQDISRRKKAEDALLQWEKQHLQKQKREALARLAGGVACDFNNCLTVITGYSDLLLGVCSHQDPGRRYMEEISHAAHRAATVARQLQAFSGGQVLNPSAVQLNTLLQRMDKMVRRLAGEEIEVVVIPDPKLAAVRADPAQIEQVLLDLVVNACDAMPDGGRLTLETANVHLDEAVLDPESKVPSGAYAMLALTHTGAGMDEETRAHLFEPYFNGQEKELGGPELAAVYGVIKQSGGTIEVYSDPAGETTFWIYLPAVPAPAADGAGPAPVENLQGTETILLMDSDPAVRTLTSHILRSRGYGLLEAADVRGALAVAEARDGPIDLVIADLSAGGDGRDLAATLRALRPDSRVLVLSAHWAAIPAAGESDPKTAFLQKPFTPDDLARKVREVLDGG